MYSLLIIPIAIALILLSPPITIKTDKINSNAQNGWVFIKMKKDLGPYWSAIWAQEYYEINLKKKNPLKRLLRNRDFMRNMEIVSHEIEVQEAVRASGADETSYRQKEAKAVAEYKQFGGEVDWTTIEVEMKKASGEALRFISKNSSKILKMRANNITQQR